MYYLDEEPKRTPVRKFIILLLVLAAAYFALQKWSPTTFQRLAFWKKPDKAAAAPPAEVRIEPAPSATPPATGSADPQPPKQTPAISSAVDKNAQVAVLLYHRVEAKASAALRIAPAVFEEHMERLKTSGITVISMQDFLAWRRGEKTIPARSALITIDDGFSSAFEVARPILKKYGYPWTCFVYTNFISRGSSITWEQLAQLRDEGVEIGCHSVSHLNLRDQQGKTPEAYEDWLKQEILGAKQLIEQRLGIRCATYAYPFGSFSNRVLEHIKLAGYEAAFTLGSARVAFGTAADRIPRYSWLDEHPQNFNPVFAWTGRAQAADAPTAIPVGNPTALTLLTEPTDGEVIRDPKPVIRANLTTLGAFDPGSVSLRLSGSGLIPHSWTDATKQALSAKIPKALIPGEYTVTITALVGGKRVDSQWKFRFDPTGSYDDVLAPAPK